jgi:hypothetical protein
MGAGDVRACEDHHHQRGADGKWGERAGAIADDRAANGDDEKNVPISSAKYLFMSLPSSAITARRPRHITRVRARMAASLASLFSC